ncbi:hypothetical protein M9Y10_007677 [Tritrichomonas musculus]|uniref:Protein kinase domain-containing protein n=1 Tax=Tritrichomonas musculus TaxID=1915356 RepID=A0ABR2J2Z7_9EUKA
MTGQIGTPLYMAPELFEGDCHYGPGVDVYAFSMIAFEIVSGEVPFNEFSGLPPVALAVKAASGKRPKIPASVPSKMAKLIRRCWSQEAESRPSFDEVFSELSSDLSMLGDDVDEDEIFSGIFSSLPSPSSCSCSFSSSMSMYNYKKAIKYYEEAAELGNSYAINGLGVCYYNGEGVKQNYAKAIEYYKKGAELGNSYAINGLGLCYENCEGVARNMARAIECYEKSAEMGNHCALRNLAICYEDGVGVTRNMSKAIEYYEKSAKLGNENAKNRLRELKGSH